MKTIEDAYKTLKKEVPSFPETLLILGSGWNKILDETKIEKRISYEKLFGIKTSVPGHTGELIIGKTNNKRVAYMSGRFHMYEGYSGFEATMPIRLFAKFGIKNLVLTAACGALNEKYKVGDFVILSDVITLFLALDNPLKGAQFVDVSEVFNPSMREKAHKICVESHIPFHEGTYVYYHGPNYETPADKMALRFLGADVVGMSTVPETLVARSLNINVLGLSFVTNLAFVKHDHKEVVAEANKASEKMKILLTEIIK
ncbi:MAG: purine-nucleoside phosphorylase [Candidatus Roizmanbacteria bacterium]|nr:purine-nucleoside phosphorylase [Candidatus Roizmanbacteria bacterium]